MATEGERIITKSFRVSLKVSNFLGLSPIQYSKSSGKFEFKIKSSPTIFCVIACVFRILLTLQYASDFILGWPLATASFHGSSHREEQALLQRSLNTLKGKAMSHRQRSIILVAVKVFYCLVCLSQFRRLFVPWIRTNAFVAFLNNWSTFEQEIILHAKSNTEIITTRRSSGVRACLMISLCIAFVVCLLISIYFAIQHFHTVDASLLFRLTGLLYTPLWYTMIYSAEMLDDVITMMSYQMTAMGFNMIKPVVQCMGHGRPIPPCQSIALHRLLIQVQTQCKNLNEYLRLNELILLFECIVLSTTLVFLLAHVDWNSSTNVAVRLHWTVYVFSLLMRMFCKGWLAEQIGESEASLSEELACLIGTVEDVPTLIQLKTLHDITRTAPSRIRLGKGYFDRGVMLTVLSTVVTYLIVLMQFMEN